MQAIIDLARYYDFPTADTYDYQSGENYMEIYLDGVSFNTVTFDWDRGFNQCHIEGIGSGATATKSVKIVFGKKKKPPIHSEG